jgi:hypothetical protein
MTMPWHVDEDWEEDAETWDKMQDDCEPVEDEDLNWDEDEDLDEIGE